MNAPRSVPCTIGLDFGTASVRALVVETQTGTVRGSGVSEYRHGVIDRSLPGTGAPLGVDWALQHPGDYVESMEYAIRNAVADAPVDPQAIAGIGVDFTSCTILPVDRAGRPLCLRPELAPRPHAWVKLWKHHAAQPQADRINAVATARAEPFLANYGGRTSSEWLVAKTLQMLDEDPAVYEAAHAIVEAGDWIVWQLTGVLARNACGAGYKAFWTRGRGFPTREFFAALDPRLADLESKLTGTIAPPGRRVGTLTPAMARRLGLAPGTAVAAAIIDAHSAVPAAGVVSPGRMVLVLGTSTCHMLLADRHAPVEGIGGIVYDGIVEGYYGYEAGQAAVGDIFNWFVGQTRETGDPFGALEREAAAVPAGGHGLLALDWWNGNRSVLANADLTGLLIGLTLSTTRGEIYRSLIEATGYGTRRILEAFEQQNIPVTELIAVGGLAERSPLLLQIYADITRRPIRIASGDACARGAAMLGAVAAGETAGGHRSLVEAAACMARLTARQVEPEHRASQVLDHLYREYLALHDYFGRGGNDVMVRLRQVHRATRAGVARIDPSLAEAPAH
jgi:L-ribulokinase